MDDIISRQEAINLFEKYGAEDDAITLLNSLPSAQPGWIPTLDKLPDITDTYIVMVGINECGEGMHTEVRTADWNKVYKTWNVHESEKSIVGEVTAWMPSPKLYGWTKR